VPRLLAVGHVTWDRIQDQTVLGGTVTYAAHAASRLGWQVGVLTSAGPDFDPGGDLPEAPVFVERAPATTRFANHYDGEDGGRRHQVLSARAGEIALAPLPAEWRQPDVLLLGPVAGEVPVGMALAFEAEVVGAIAQGWVREFDPAGNVSAAPWVDPGRDLAGVHVLFLSQHDLPDAARHARELLSVVPVVVLTRGWEGATVFTRQSVQDVPSLPRQEVDPTGAGDVFAAAFLLRYHETGDLGEAAAFGACAASCAVEGLGTSALGDRAEIERRLALRERLIEEGEWDE
jgi:sugar/nucleoside kinase (ribokinase family)